MTQSKTRQIFNALRLASVWFYLLVISLWTAGAVYFDIGSRVGGGLVWLIAWVVFVGALLIFVKPKWVSILVVTLAFTGVAAWWLTLKPSHQRVWDQDFSMLPDLTVEDDVLMVHNVRTMKIGGGKQDECCFEDREYLLSELRAVDLIILYWDGSTAMSHPIVVFDFGPSGHLCFSIEVRYQKDQDYNLLRGIYRQYELMYVVSDEKDAILRRTKGDANNELFLYRYQIDNAMANTILKEFIRETNDVFQRPRWYNGVTANCTTSIYRQHEANVQWDWRMLFNGSMDKMLYDWGCLYQDIPFEDLKTRSKINDRANAADLDDFSKTIRDGLPGF